MFIERVNPEKCIRCGKCVAVCGPDVYQIQYEPMLEENPSTPRKIVHVLRDPDYDGCIACGHCVAICPTEAIEYSQADPPYSLHAIEKVTDIPYTQIYELLRMRRSIREYTSNPLSQEQITQILEAMRYAPSASNQQAWQYIVITDPNEIRRLMHTIISKMKFAIQLLSLKCVQKVFLWGQLREAVKDPGYLRSAWRILDRATAGEDPIFFNAPCVIILHSPKYGNLGGNDAGIAFTHGMLAAQALGLGTCWIGFAQEVLHRFRSQRVKLRIPKNHQVWGVMTVGHPIYRYLRAPPRNSLTIQWINPHIEKQD